MTRFAGSRPDHAKAAAKMREHPGVWMHIATCRTSYTAKGVAYRVRTATRQSVYEPTGAFEARVQQLDDGTAVIARWLGPEKEAALRKAAALAAVHAGGDPR